MFHGHGDFSAIDLERDSGSWGCNVSHLESLQNVKGMYGLLLGIPSWGNGGNKVPIWTEHGFVAQS